MTFSYTRPGSLDEAFAVLRDAPDARVLCGGTDLIVGLRKGTINPSRVVDLKGIAELTPGVDVREGMLRIGATTILTEVIEDSRVKEHVPALVEGARVVGSIQIRNRATLAGNVCNASPAADTVPALLVYDAVVELRSRDGVRRVALADFIVGPGRTILRSGEIVSAIELPIPTTARGSAFGRMTRRRGVDLATVNLCCLVTADGTTRFAFGAVGPRAFVVTDDGGTLADPGATEDARGQALARMTAQATPISNVRASREYRQAMLEVLSRRALDTARRRLEDSADAG